MDFIFSGRFTLLVLVLSSKSFSISLTNKKFSCKNLLLSSPLMMSIASKFCSTPQKKQKHGVEHDHQFASVVVLSLAKQVVHKIDLLKLIDWMLLFLHV